MRVRWAEPSRDSCRVEEWAWGVDFSRDEALFIAWRSDFDEFALLSHGVSAFGRMNIG